MKQSWNRVAPAALALLLLTVACEGEPQTTAQVNDPVRTIGGDRPATLTLPSGYTAGTPIPLVIVLHGYTGNAGWTDRYFGISRRTNEDQIAVILPNGTRGPDDRSFWNATDYCCDFYQSGVDDVGYLNSLVEEAAEHMQADGVYLVGLSNGGFMSHRMACESMPGLKAIASVAARPSKTRPGAREPDRFRYCTFTAPRTTPYDMTGVAGGEAMCAIPAPKRPCGAGPPARGATSRRPRPCPRWTWSGCSPPRRRTWPATDPAAETA